MSENKTKPTICLVMIVRNESGVIRRCLNSVSKYINEWVIVDTGSNDGTQDIIKDHMAGLGIPGNLYERQWKDFGTNRTESLRLAAGRCDYRLVIDADDVLEVEDPSVFEALDKDCYRLPIHLDGIVYKRIQLIRSSQDWQYIGVLHEYIKYMGDDEIEESDLAGVKMIAGVSSDKRDALKGRDKYYNDALIFEREILNNKELDEGLKSRYWFYCGQSYRDAGMPDRSIAAYEKRIELGGWEEEVYISLLNIAKMKALTRKPIDEVEKSLFKAWEYRPIRLEAPYELMRLLTSQGRYFLAFSIGNICLRMGGCSDLLFVEHDIWHWKFLDDYSVAAFHTNNLNEAVKCAKTLVESPVWYNIPEKEQKRIKKNLESYEAAIAERDGIQVDEEQPVQPPSDEDLSKPGDI